MEHRFATSEREKFTRSRSVASQIGIETFAHVAETGSTNADLAAQVRRGDRGPAVLVADHQTAGRGRRDRAWQDDSRGQLLVSIRLPAPESPSAAAQAMAASVHTAMTSLGVDVGVKWPNDVIVEAPSTRPGKLAGVLSELVDGMVVLGVGANIDSAPLAEATSLADNGVTTSRDDLLAEILVALDTFLDNPFETRRHLLASSATLGRQVRVTRTMGLIEGTAVDLDPAGCLVLDVDGELHSISEGDVVHLRAH